LSLDSILTRLKDMHSEIASLNEFKEPPTQILLGATPLCYAIARGFEEFPETEDLIQRDYRIDVEVLVRRWDEDQISATITSQGTQEVHTWIATMTSYYSDHRMMATDAVSGATAELAYIRHPGIGIACEGLIFPLTASDGNLYFGTRFNLRVPMAVEIATNF